MCTVASRTETALPWAKRITRPTRPPDKPCTKVTFNGSTIGPFAAALRFGAAHHRRHAVDGKPFGKGTPFSRAFAVAHGCNAPTMPIPTPPGSSLDEKTSAVTAVRASTLSRAPPPWHHTQLHTIEYRSRAHLQAAAR